MAQPSGRLHRRLTALHCWRFRTAPQGKRYPVDGALRRGGLRLPRTVLRWSCVCGVDELGRGRVEDATFDVMLLGGLNAGLTQLVGDLAGTMAGLGEHGAHGLPTDVGGEVRVADPQSESADGPLDVGRVDRK